jgi:citrate synthase
MQEQIVVSKGLEGIVAAETRLSKVDGERGELIIAGFRLDELAQLPFEEVVRRIWDAAGEKAPEIRALPLPQHALALLEAAARERAEPMDALRMAVGTLLAQADRQAAALLAGSMPTIVAAYARLLGGAQPIEPRRDLGLAANYLYMRTGSVPEPASVHALDTYLATVSDHGLNASTFTARVIVSTQSDFVSAIVGAIGALKGPLHGGAPGPALDMVFEIGERSKAEPYLRAKLERGERLMGFGHRVYRVRDPRADVLSAAAERMFTSSADASLYELARSVEQLALELLAEFKPHRKLQTNVEFFTALLLHGLGI